MAKSTGTKGFDFRGSLLGVDASPMIVEVIIAGSQTLTLGDAVRVNNAGNAVVVAAGEAIAGILVGVVDQRGMNVFSPRANSTNTSGATLTGDDTVATASTNASDATKNLKAQIALALPGNSLYYNDANGDLAQTNLFQFFDTTSSGDQIDEGSASDSNGQFQLIKLNPDGDGDLSKGLFVANETQLPGTALDSATAKVAA